MAIPKRPLRNDRDNADPPAPNRQKAQPQVIRLIRTETDEDGIQLVFDADGKEVSWQLEQTSVLEFFALILKGQMREGQRIVVQGDVTLEPPDANLKHPMMCFTGNPLQTCVPITRPALRALRDEIDHVLSLKR